MRKLFTLASDLAVYRWFPWMVTCRR